MEAWLNPHGLLHDLNGFPAKPRRKISSASGPNSERRRITDIRDYGLSCGRSEGIVSPQSVAISSAGAVVDEAESLALSNAVDADEIDCARTAHVLGNQMFRAHWRCTIPLAQGRVASPK